MPIFFCALQWGIVTRRYEAFQRIYENIGRFATRFRYRFAFLCGIWYSEGLPKVPILANIRHKTGEKRSFRRPEKMGGNGSGRWGTHRKATAVEDVPLRLALDRRMARHIRAGGLYQMTWTQRGGLLAGQQSSVGYLVIEGGRAIRLQ
jgi:hypothetical protein